jgi:hypothetical protein
MKKLLLSMCVLALLGSESMLMSNLVFVDNKNIESVKQSLGEGHGSLHVGKDCFEGKSAVDYLNKESEGFKVIPVYFFMMDYSSESCPKK